MSWSVTRAPGASSASTTSYRAAGLDLSVKLRRLAAGADHRGSHHEGPVPRKFERVETVLLTAASALSPRRERDGATPRASFGDEPPAAREILEVAGSRDVRTLRNPLERWFGAWGRRRPISGEARPRGRVPVPYPGRFPGAGGVRSVEREGGPERRILLDDPLEPPREVAPVGPPEEERDRGTSPPSGGPGSGAARPRPPGRTRRLPGWRGGARRRAPARIRGLEEMDRGSDDRGQGPFHRGREFSQEVDPERRRGGGDPDRRRSIAVAAIVNASSSGEGAGRPTAAPAAR